MVRHAPNPHMYAGDWQMVKNPHIIELTKRIVIGEGVLEKIHEFIPTSIKKSLVKKRVFVITGPNVWSRYGKLLEYSFDRLEASIEIYKASEAHVSVAEILTSMTEAQKASAIVGIGGGKSIDLAKYCASRLKKPLISIPTAASHDGIASPFSSLKGTGKPTSIKTVEPLLLLADLVVITEAPKRLLVAGAGDMIAKFTAVQDWRLAHLLHNEYYGEYSASLAMLSAKHIVKYSNIISKHNIDSARIILEALISSSVAMGIAGSTRPASGSEHLFSHALDIIAKKPALHGEQTGVGTIMMAKLHRLPWRKIRGVLRKIGAPTTAKELGVSDVDVIKALTIAHKIRPERYTILGERGLTWEAAERLARDTGVIS